MMVKLPYGYFMDEPQMFEKHSDPVKKTIDKIQKIAKQGLSTDELVIHLRQNEALSSEERQHIARITNKGGDLVSLVKALDIHTIQTKKTPITQALAQLAELAVTHGARTPYLTKKEIEQMEQDFIDMKNEEVD